MRDFLERARRLSALTRGTGAQLAINGRLDVALLVQAHLHLPVDGPRPEEVRRFLPKDRWLSAAVHDHREVRAAAGADAFLVSPVFPPGSKPGDSRPTLGPEGFGELVRLASPTPCVALGGITPERVKSLRPCRAVAVQGAILRSATPGEVARALLDALRSAGGPRA